VKAALLAFLVAASVTTWAYTKLQNHTGYGNAQTTTKAAAMIFIVTFVVVFTIGQMILR
jgi:hypothetical protein